MAVYTTFFIADPAKISDAFPGWKLPLPAPVRREIRNIFTKQIMIIETTAPEWREDEQAPPTPEYRVVSIQGRYEDYLEDRLESSIQEKPHWAAKGLYDLQLNPLVAALGISAKLHSPLYGPPSIGAVLREFPPDFIPKLQACDQRAVARQWAAEMSTPEHTHSIAGDKLSNDWRPEDALALITKILELTRQASADQRLYLLIEP
jgi:hypothetical protein